MRIKKLVAGLLQYRMLALIALAAWVGGGIYFFPQLDIEAYPDPSPPLVEVITQNTSWSAEEVEKQVTVPIEVALNGMPRLESIRSISIFGLSDVKLYFDFDSDYFRDRQEVLNRLQSLTLANNLQPQLSPWSPIGEIYRYQLVGPQYTLDELKATQDWFVRRELKQVPGIIDITTFGGTTRQYQVEVSPNKLLSTGVTLPQVINALQAGNANAGGNYLSLGPQNVNVRSIGLLTDSKDIGSIVVTQRGATPVLVRDVADVHEGIQPRLGKVGRNGQQDIVQGTVLLQRDEKSLPALDGLRRRIAALNNGLLPAGMKILTIYDRSSLIAKTTATVHHVIFTGLVLVTLLLLGLLGDIRLTIITALTIPIAVLFAFALMAITGRSANLLSIGAIDFGILVDSAIVVMESIYRALGLRVEGESVISAIAEATERAARPVLFATVIILVAFVPLFTMRGVPGKIFAPMSVTYAFALTGALIFALIFAPVLASFGHKHLMRLADENTETRASNWIRKRYNYFLRRLLGHPRPILITGVIFLAASLVAFHFVGGEFMPPLEEGNLWIRCTLPQDISFEKATMYADQFRNIVRSFPEVVQTVSQTGRPDDGTDPSTFNNIEISAELAPSSRWPARMTKEKLIEEIQTEFQHYPGVSFNFSQNIQDNVEEAMSGVKGENSLKLFGEDFNLLTQKAGEIADLMSHVKGVQDVGVFRVNGQPGLLIQVDRAKAARYGLAAADVNLIVQTAIGGNAVSQILQGDRRFDLVVRYKPEYRSSPEAIRNILVPTPDGGHVPLSQIADVRMANGSFMIYRENDKRYVPIKFSVRGRDLATTMSDLQSQLASKLQLPSGYSYEWAGEFDSLRKEQRRLALVVPVSLLMIAVLLYVQFHSWRDSLLVLGMLPFAVTGGIWALLFWHTSFSISAAVGFTSLIGVATLGCVVFLSGIRHAQSQSSSLAGLEQGSVDEMRPVLMACLAAGLGLLPAALSSGIGAQAQQPLARVVVGGMVTTILTILFGMPAVLRVTQQVSRKSRTSSSLRTVVQ